MAGFDNDRELQEAREAVAAHRQRMAIAERSDNFYFTNGRRKADLETLADLDARVAERLRELSAESA